MVFDFLRDKVLGSIRVRRAYSWASKIPLVGGTLRAITRQILPSGSHEWIRVPSGLAKGVYILVDPRSELGYVRGDHEPWIASILSKWLRPADTFVDVGAHIGYFSLSAAGLVGSRGSVIACEPDPQNYSRLRANIERNSLEQVIQSHQAAVGGSSADGIFRRGPEAHGRVTGSLVGGEVDGERAEYLRVPVLSLDDLCHGEMPRAIKIDVEGGEADVLNGASKIIHTRHTRWIIELHNEIARDKVLARLVEGGYKVQLSQPSHPVYHDYHQEYAVAEPPDLP